MSKRTYHPDRGDLIEINFNPAVGREIDKRRPAIVISPISYNKSIGFCLAVPTSTLISPGPFWIRMPEGYLPAPSIILCDYLKSFDYRERGARFLARVPERLIQEIVGNLLDIIDPVTG